ncbi:MAG TPA: PilZ domain-containing protein [Sphingomicrobium sp.]|nr:PilZ domain-containing protein [Sphingomicrobium sp.]
MNSTPRPEGQPDRRRAPRASLRLSASIREPGRGRTGVRIIDLSTHGCQIEATAGATADTWVLLSIAGIETQYCRIVWRINEFAGLEFATPIAEPVLERLLQDHQLSESSIKELRDIAERTHNLSAKHGLADAQTLADLSRSCALDAVVEGFRLTDGNRPG